MIAKNAENFEPFWLLRFIKKDMEAFFPAYILVRWKERVSDGAETSLLHETTAVRGGIYGG